MSSREINFPGVPVNTPAVKKIIRKLDKEKKTVKIICSIYMKKNFQKMINDINLKTEGKQVRQKLDRIQKQLEQVKNTGNKDKYVIGKGTNNAIYVNNGNRLLEKTAEEKKKKYIITNNENRFKNEYLILSCLLSFLYPKQPAIFARNVQHFKSNQINDKYQTDVVRYLKTKRGRDRYVVDDDLYEDLIANNMILPIGDNKLANYLTDNKAAQDGKIKITSFARCDLDDGVREFYKQKNITRFDYSHLFDYTDDDKLVQHCNIHQAKGVSSKIEAKLEKMQPQSIIDRLQQQFSIAGVDCNNQTIVNALTYYLKMLTQLKQAYCDGYDVFTFNPKEYQQELENYIAHPRPDWLYRKQLAEVNATKKMYSQIITDDVKKMIDNTIKSVISEISKRTSYEKKPPIALENNQDDDKASCQSDPFHFITEDLLKDNAEQQVSVPEDLQDNRDMEEFVYLEEDQRQNIPQGTGVADWFDKRPVWQKVLLNVATLGLINIGRKHNKSNNR